MRPSSSPSIDRDRAAIEGVLTEVANRFEDVAVVAKREAERLRRAGRPGADDGHRSGPRHRHPRPRGAADARQLPLATRADRADWRDAEETSWQPLSSWRGNDTALSRDQINHLQRLIGDWGMLADLCFADLLLYTLDRDGRWLVLAQVRPVTGQTLYFSDWVGHHRQRRRDRADRRVVRGPVRSSMARHRVESLPEPTQIMAIPVIHEDHAIAVLTREWSNLAGRQRGELERTYLSLFERFATMISVRHVSVRGPVAARPASPPVSATA